MVVCPGMCSRKYYKINFNRVCYNLSLSPQTICMEVITMENDYQVASISEDCVSEINELQNKLNKETDKDIVLIAYQSKTDD